MTADRASVRALVDTAAYEVVSGSGAVQTHAARPGQPMQFTLRWVDGRWQVEQVDAS